MVDSFGWLQIALRPRADKERPGTSGNYDEDYDGRTFQGRGTLLKAAGAAKQQGVHSTR
jgi:hypothetical protein